MDSDKAFFSTEFLTEFLEKYRSLPCLWKVKSIEYSNTVTRQRGWEELTDFCRSINPTANSTWVKRKVQNLRGSFRKELKKINASINSGAEVIYKPKLWYYDLLLFTKDDAETPREYLTIVDTDDEDAGCAAEDLDDTGAVATVNDDDSTTNPEFEHAQSNQVWQNTHLKRRRIDMNAIEEEDPLIHKPLLDLNKPDDEYDAIGKAVGAKLRKIASVDYMQFVLADKLINDVLYQGLLQQLTPTTTDTNSSPAVHQVPTSTLMENWNIATPPVDNGSGHFWVNADSSLQIVQPDPSQDLTGSTSPLERKVFSEPND